MVILDETNKEEFFRELVRFIELGQIELFRKDFLICTFMSKPSFFKD